MADHDSGSTMHRAELARGAGCNIETVRYYERIGMMPDPPRSAAGYRVYDRGHASRLRFILRARELGFSLEEVRSLLALVDARNQTCAQVKECTDRRLQDVRARIADLLRIETVLAQTAALCSGEDVPDCPILDALSS